MINFLKQIFTWWHRQTVWELSFILYLQENFVVKINLEINIILILKEKDG